MGSIGAKKASSRVDEFNGYFGERSDEDAIERLTWIKDNNIVNPNYVQSSDYRRNCALCATAVALQMRGYDVEAMPRDKDWRGFDSIFDVDYSNPDNYILSGSRYRQSGVPGAYEISNKYNIDPPRAARGASAVAKQIEDKVKGWGNGAVGVLNVKWKDNSSAHAINIINQNGVVFGYDSQSNKIIPNLTSYMKRTIANHTQLVRLDNAPIRQDLQQDALRKMVKKRDKSLAAAFKRIDNMFI